eukprot:9792593-Heterocapsa_arctica.AAC.1
MVETEGVMHEHAQVALLRANPLGAFAESTGSFLGCPPVLCAQDLGRLQHFGVSREVTTCCVEQRSSCGLKKALP